MGYLTRNDMHKLLDIAGKLYSNAANPDFIRQAVKAVDGIVPAEVIHFASMDFSSGERMYVPSANDIFPESFVNDLPRFIHLHPAFHTQVARHFPPRPGKPGLFNRNTMRSLAAGHAVKLSGAYLSGAFVRSELYNEWFRPYGVKDQLGVNFVHTGSRVDSIGITRIGAEFTERERQKLNLLSPHFRQTFAMHAAASARRRDAEMTPEAALPHIKKRLGLTSREAEVLYWVGQGKGNGDISDILGGISPLTVKKHMVRIFEKIGVENRTAAALMVMELRSKDPKSC